MKKDILVCVLLFSSFLFSVNAQNVSSRKKDTLQESINSPARIISPVNKAEEIKMKNKAEIEAEKESKEKGSNKNQTHVEPDKIAPRIKDSVKNLPKNK